MSNTVKSRPVRKTDNDNLFYAEVRKGYVIKVTLDILAVQLSRSVICLGDDGITLRGSDDGKHVLFDLDYIRKNFKVYRCHEESSLSFKVKFLQKLVRNVKKKDSMVIKINRNRPSVVIFEIRSEGAKSVPRIEEFELAVQREEGRISQALPDGNYGHPMVIDSSEFQKIKKFTTINVKVIKVVMQSNNYISFMGGSDKVFSNKLSFGDIVDDPEDVGPDEESNEDGIMGYYEEEFNMSTFQVLIKTAGLGPQLRFYRPKIHAYPLLVEASAGDLGAFRVFIKDKNQIELEERVRKEQEEAIIVTSET